MQDVTKETHDHRDSSDEIIDMDASEEPTTAASKRKMFLPLAFLVVVVVADY